MAFGSSSEPFPHSAERAVSVERVRHTLYALVFATAVCGGMLLARFAYANEYRYRFSGLFGNLLLAWIPLILALLIRRISSRGLWFWLALLTWILFFPNAFYIVTDLIHLKKFGTGGIYPWYDILLTAGFACSGMFLGTLSLYLLHLGIRQRFGWRAGWLFAVSTLALGALGIYLGRFLRLNSWDVVTRPVKLVGKVSTLMDLHQSDGGRRVFGHLLFLLARRLLFPRLDGAFARNSLAA